MFEILIDACVWLDLAKDYQGQSVLGVLEELVRQKQVSIILPRTVLDEFSRNKARVAEEGGGRSALASAIFGKVPGNPRAKLKRDTD